MFDQQIGIMFARGQVFESWRTEGFMSDTLSEWILCHRRLRGIEIKYLDLRQVHSDTEFYTNCV